MIFDKCDYILSQDIDMGAAICGCGDVQNTSDTRRLPPGYTGDVVRARLTIALPNPLINIIWEYARELEIYFPPADRPISARYIYSPQSRWRTGDDQNLWNAPELSCTLTTRDNGLYCRFMARNPKALGYDLALIWQGALIKYANLSDQEYNNSNTALAALKSNSTIFALPWRSAWEREILTSRAIVGIEHMLPIMFDGMHDLWMLEMTRQW